jgi:hypothetical protein
MADEAVKDAVCQWFWDYENDFFKDRIQELVKMLTKVY